MSAIDGLSSLSSSLTSSLFATNSASDDSSFADLLAQLQGSAEDTTTDWIDQLLGGTASSSGQSWISALFNADTITTDSGEYLSLDGVYDMFTSTFNDFANTASSLFASAGMNFSMSASLTLQATGTGSLSAASSDSALESTASAVVSRNTSLTADFMITAAFASISYAASNDAQFTADYNEDPAATMEKYEDILKDYLLSFQINFSASGTSYSFADTEDSSTSATASSTPSSSSAVA